jgi:hypothetical protein
MGVTGKEAMITYVMIAAFAVLVFITMSESLSSYNGKPRTR